MHVAALLFEDVQSVVEEGLDEALQDGWAGSAAVARGLLAHARAELMVQTAGKDRGQEILTLPTELESVSMNWKVEHL